MPRLIGPFASLISALIGAGVGGWITYEVATEDTRAQMMMRAYNLYMTEAARAQALAKQARFDDDDKARLSGATAVLFMYGSREIVCQALNFEEQVHAEESQEGLGKYVAMMWRMRAEITENMDLVAGQERCILSPDLY